MIAPPRFHGFIRTFILLCSAVFVLQQFARWGPLGGELLETELIRFLGLVPELVFKGAVYQLVTWMFLHGNLMHFLFNMLALWMFGSLLLEAIGPRRLFYFVFISGILSGVIICLFGLIDPMTYHIPTIGASGVIFALLIAISRLFPHQVVLVFFLFPMKMKYFAVFMVLIEFYLLYTSNAQGVSNIGHLGGAAVGYFYISYLKLNGGQQGGSWFKQLRDRWHYRRMRKKIKVIRQDEKRTYH